MSSREGPGRQPPTYTIGQVAGAAHVSVRALHHYDEIGLVKPSGRSAKAYRLYTTADLERLQQALFYRELGFPLEEILHILADPAFDRRGALLAHRARLAEQAARAQGLLLLVDRTIARLEQGETMTPEEMFDGFDPSQYEKEAKARWGATASYAESARRTARYTKEDWAKIRAESDALTRAFAEAMEQGVPPSGTAAMDVAERHRMHIDRWFYPCSAQMHVGLGDMYVGDTRFAANYEKARAGLAAYVCDAIRANADRAGAPIDPRAT
jgi:DNA-binding transcriptional MerR regulator